MEGLLQKYKKKRAVDEGDDVGVCELHFLGLMTRTYEKGEYYAETRGSGIKFWKKFSGDVNYVPSRKNN